MAISKALFICGTLLSTAGFAQTSLREGNWRAAIIRKDGIEIPFDLEVADTTENPKVYVVNGTERILLEKGVAGGDSIVWKMPVFESWFKLKAHGNARLDGFWVSGSENGDVRIPMTAIAGKARFPATASGNVSTVSGKWAVEFTRPNQTKRKAIAQFEQQGGKVTGSVLTPSGDYRYLTGTMSGDSLRLSTFDGSHALMLTAYLKDGQLTGDFYAGFTARETWTAVRSERPELTAMEAAVKSGEDSTMHFAFKDLDGRTVSLDDERFRNKVVVLQIMGSWCPNCMDETRYLADFYQKNNGKDVEIIALAYELSTNESRSVASMRKFQQRFQVAYPMLYTGVTASDPERTAKTLPSLTPLKAFPTTILLDRSHKVRDITSGFYGPGAPEYHLKYKSHFEGTIESLLAK
ncbi:Peroxiredoxin [Dyadobacter soli]|uniref:Peroxiredoxin n=1 Tax=Dyadobacter soli TaxID=659014 RepID=A0A1G6VR74_9BACT|nr:TlpA disulfide reductase family protein [Dyadobacter soli]SDD55913.1 Peroxiredoxin [Dyadobacter soli]